MTNYVLDKTSSPLEYNVVGLNSTSRGGKILAIVSDAPSPCIHILFGSKNYLIYLVWQADFGIRAKTVVGKWNHKMESVWSEGIH
jgi:hypothetical protein